MPAYKAKETIAYGGSVYKNGDVVEMSEDTAAAFGADYVEKIPTQPEPESEPVVPETAPEADADDTDTPPDTQPEPESEPVAKKPKRARNNKK